MVGRAGLPVAAGIVAAVLLEMPVAYGATETDTVPASWVSGSLLPPAGEILERFGPDQPVADSSTPTPSTPSIQTSTSTTRPASGWLLGSSGSDSEGSRDTRPEERQVVQRRGGAGWSAGRKAEGSPISRQEAGTSFWPGWEVLPLAVVVALILGVAWVIKRFMPGSRMLTGAGVMEIVARLPLSGKQSLLLVKVGRRLILLGVSAERITALDVLDDPEQAALLLGEAASRRSDSISQAFADAFGRETHQYMEHDSPSNDASWGAVRGLLEKVRRLAGRQELMEARNEK